jgi:hypothetical protein
MKTFTEVVRSCVDTLDKCDASLSGPDLERVASSALEPMRTALAERGQKPNCHVGKKNLTEEEELEWYAGQGLDIIDSKAWHAVNSWINCKDKFAPKGST